MKWILVSLSLLSSVRIPAQYFKMEYPPSADSNELRLGVTYTLWVPPGVSVIRGIIVHQHGAGTLAAKSGESAAYDLHWQALAKKWGCALMGPSYHVLNDKTDASPGGAQLWFDPRRGSDKAFLRAVDEFAVSTGHGELKNVPWVLWGHSGGAIWADIMMMLHPGKVAAVWLRSGTEEMWHDRPGFPAMDVPDAVYGIPLMCNPGIQEKDNLIGKGLFVKFRDYRARGAPVSFAFDPLTGHWTGNSRYLAIPFLDACMGLRLGAAEGVAQVKDGLEVNGVMQVKDGSQVLRPIGKRGVWVSAADVHDSVWLPDARVARRWAEYVTTGVVSDSTVPPAPFDVRVKDAGEKGVEIVWRAEADLESGLRNFVILRDGQELGNFPAVNLIRFQVLPTFQSGWINSYNDAPANPVPEMRFIDPWPKDKQRHSYAVVSVNTAGLRSKPSKEAGFGVAGEGLQEGRLLMASMISDNMILQRNKRLPIWGWATPAAGVDVMFMRRHYHTVADGDGKWSVSMEPCGAGGPYEMSISAGKDTIYVKNILIGEVWLCSGQSNMVLDFNNEGVKKLYAAEMAASANGQIRQLLVGRSNSDTPAAHFQTSGWRSASPQTLPAFSAAAYFFALTLYEKYHVPVGIINASLGGTVAEAWTSEEGLKGLPVVTEKVEPKNKPSVLYNAMIAPLAPYAVRGVAWYQGEYNTHKAYAYRKLFPALIRDWRRTWGDTTLPFIFQQLPNFQAAVAQPSENEWAELREAQLLTLKTAPYTAMSVAIDIGGANELHPADKQDIGHRLALQAERLAYGERKIVASGPLYRGMRVAGNKIVVSFDLFGSSLVAKGGDSLAYFAIAGADRKFVWAKAEIRGATVEVSAPQVEHPVAVRYAWAGNPEGCNLYNKEGLPASPFRTDDWPGLTVGN